MIIFSLFGTTTGLELINLPLTEAAASIRIDDEWVEISESHAKLNRERDVIVVERRSVGPNVLTWVGLYRHAREIGYDRSGTFYGAGCWLVNSVADSKGMIETLRHLADQVKQCCINGDKFEKRIADAVGSIKLPEGAMALLQRVEKLVDGCSPSGEAAFIGAGQNVLEVVDWAQRAQSSVAYSKVIVGGSDSAPSSPRRSGFHVFASLVYAIEYSFHCGLIERKSLRSEAQEKKNLQEKLAAVQEREAVHVNEIALYRQREINLIKEKDELSQIIRTQSQSLQRRINGDTIRTSPLSNQYSVIQETFANEAAQYIGSNPSSHAQSSSIGKGASSNLSRATGVAEATGTHGTVEPDDQFKSFERTDKGSDNLGLLTKILLVIFSIGLSFIVGFGFGSRTPGCFFASVMCNAPISTGGLPEPKSHMGAGEPQQNQDSGGGSGADRPDSPPVTPPPPGLPATTSGIDGGASGSKPKQEKSGSGKSTPPQSNSGQR